MCGIVGFIGEGATKYVGDTLKLLQYRGYDSAGIGVNVGGEFFIQKCVGSVDNLDIDSLPNSTCAIGHTRWATHGEVSIVNSHPCIDDFVAVVHNGIFENYVDLEEQILGKADTELDSLAFTKCLRRMLDNKTINPTTVSKTIADLLALCNGSWAVCVMIKQCPNILFFAKNKSPLVIGKGDSDVFLCSDIGSICEGCNYFYELDDGDFGWVSDKIVRVYDKFGKVSAKKRKPVLPNASILDSCHYEDFMQKEIEEGVESAIATFQFFQSNKLRLLEKINLKKSFFLCGCGSAYNAGLCIKYWFSKFLHKTLDCVYSSEFCYNQNINSKKDVGLFISQSGETADTIKACEIAKKQKCRTIGIINTLNSTLTPKCDVCVMTKAGSEYAVASTKTYLAQLAAGLSIVNLFAQRLEKSVINIDKLCVKLKNIDFGNMKNEIERLANMIKAEESVFFVGRGLDYYIVKEGALKLKEVSYIHVEALPAGELKHGSLALIGMGTYVVVVLSQSDLVKKTLNNIAEIKSRGGKIIMLSPFNDAKRVADIFIKLPLLDDEFMPFVCAYPLQLLAYYTARFRGVNPDRPRNLAKSVTVE